MDFIIALINHDGIVHWKRLCPCDLFLFIDSSFFSMFPVNTVIIIVQVLGGVLVDKFGI